MAADRPVSGKTPPPLPPAAARQVLDYAVPSSARSGLAVGTAVYQAIAGTVCFGLIFGMAVVVTPRFAQVFMDFKTELPAVTKVYLAISQAMQHAVFAGLVWCVCLIPALVTLLYVPPPESHYHQWARRITRWGAMLVLLGFVVLTALAVFMPMISLITAVSGGPAKH